MNFFRKLTLRNYIEIFTFIISGAFFAGSIYANMEMKSFVQEEDRKTKEYCNEKIYEVLGTILDRLPEKGKLK